MRCCAAPQGIRYLSLDIRTGFRVFEDSHASTTSRSSKDNVRFATSDLNVRWLAHFLVISGGMLGALASLAGGLGSKRTSDLQNIGLLVWAGLLLAFTLNAFAWI